MNCLCISKFTSSNESDFFLFDLTYIYFFNSHKVEDLLYKFINAPHTAFQSTAALEDLTRDVINVKSQRTKLPVLKKKWEPY